MGAVRVINDDDHFQGELNSAGTKLVVVDFTASWYVSEGYIFSIQVKYIIVELNPYVYSSFSITWG